MESMQTLSRRKADRHGLSRLGGGAERPPLSAHPGTLLTNVVGFIEDHDGLAGQLFGHQVCDLGVQEIVVAVNHHVGMQDLGTWRDKFLPWALLPPPYHSFPGVQT